MTPAAAFKLPGAASRALSMAAWSCANAPAETASTPRTIGMMRLIRYLQFIRLELPRLASASGKTRQRMPTRFANHASGDWIQYTATRPGRKSSSNGRSGKRYRIRGDTERNMRGQKKWIAIMFAGVMVCAHGQWLNYPAPGTPRTRDGKPNLSGPAPRASKGKPDLSGVWETAPSPPGEIERLLGDITYEVVPGDDPRTFSKYVFNLLADFKPQESPLR